MNDIITDNEIATANLQIYILKKRSIVLEIESQILNLHPLNTAGWSPVFPEKKRDSSLGSGY